MVRCAYWVVAFFLPDDPAGSQPRLTVGAPGVSCVRDSAMSSGSAMP